MSRKQRLSASVDVELIEAAEAAVARGRFESVSAWVNEALRAKLEHDRRLQALAAFVSAYEAEHGEITAEEMRLATPPMSLVLDLAPLAAAADLQVEIVRV